jgi:hypothetical protein
VVAPGIAVGFRCVCVCMSVCVYVCVCECVSVCVKHGSKKLGGSAVGLQKELVGIWV